MHLGDLVTVVESPYEDLWDWKIGRSSEFIGRFKAHETGIIVEERSSGKYMFFSVLTSTGCVGWIREDLIKRVD